MWKTNLLVIFISVTSKKKSKTSNVGRSRLLLGTLNTSPAHRSQLTSISGHTFISNLPKKLSFWWWSRHTPLAWFRTISVIITFIVLRMVSRKQELICLRLILKSISVNITRQDVSSRSFRNSILDKM